MKITKTSLGHEVYQFEEYEIKVALLNFIKQSQDISLSWYGTELALNSFKESYLLYHKEEENV